MQWLLAFIYSGGNQMEQMVMCLWKGLLQPGRHLIAFLICKHVIFVFLINQFWHLCNNKVIILPPARPLMRIQELYCTLGSMKQASSSSSFSVLRELCVPLVREEMLRSMLLLLLLDPWVSDPHLMSSSINSLCSGLQTETREEENLIWMHSVQMTLCPYLLLEEIENTFQWNGCS